MPRPTVDLASHLNATVIRGHPADFAVALRPVSYDDGGAHRQVPHRLAVVREDTGSPIAVVSDRYALVPHQHILDTVEEAIRPLDVGPVPRGIYVDHGGARMRAIFKFPTLAEPVKNGDVICPCLKIQNTYDGTSRVSVHIGAFRFVCTNLAVGGGGVFAGGFMSVHAGDIPIEEVARQLASYLSGFEAVVALYRLWAGRKLPPEDLPALLEPLPKRHAEAIGQECSRTGAATVYAAYNVATHRATHEMRSYRTAFDLLARINHAFQERFPLLEA